MIKRHTMAHTQEIYKKREKIHEIYVNPLVMFNGMRTNKCIDIKGASQIQRF